MLPVFQQTLPGVSPGDGLGPAGVAPHSGPQDGRTGFAELLSQEEVAAELNGDSLPSGGKQLPLPFAESQNSQVTLQGDPASGLAGGVSEELVVAENHPLLTDYHFVGTLPTGLAQDTRIQPLNISMSADGSHGGSPVLRTGMQRPETGPASLAALVESATHSAAQSPRKSPDTVTVHVPPSDLAAVGLSDPRLSPHREPGLRSANLDLKIEQQPLSASANTSLTAPGKQNAATNQLARVSIDEAALVSSSVRDRHALEAAEPGRDISTSDRRLNDLGAVLQRENLTATSASREAALPSLDKAMIAGQLANTVADANLTSVDNATARALSDASISQARVQSTAAADLVSRPIAVTVAEPAWGQELLQRVAVMTNHRLQNAEVRLSPAEMGPVRINVSIEDGAANVSFQAHHAITREAIDLALPKLREMLLEQGLTPGQTDVREEAPRERQGEAKRDSGEVQREAGAADTDTADSEVVSQRRTISGRLDTFA